MLFMTFSSTAFVLFWSPEEFYFAIYIFIAHKGYKYMNNIVIYLLWLNHKKYVHTINKNAINEGNVKIWNNIVFNAAIIQFGIIEESAVTLMLDL